MTTSPLPGLAVETPTAEIRAEYLVVAARNASRLAWWEPWAAAPVTEASVRQYLAWVDRETAAGRQIPLVIRRDGAIVGSLGARLGVGSAEIGYWLDADAEGRGIAAWAVGELLDRVRARRLPRVEALTAVDNVRSMALLERLGFAPDSGPPEPTPLDLPRGCIPRRRFTRPL